MSASHCRLLPPQPASDAAAATAAAAAAPPPPDIGTAMAAHRRLIHETRRQAVAALADGRFGESEEAFRELSQLSPSCVEALYSLAVVACLVRDYAGSARWVRLCVAQSALTTPLRFRPAAAAAGCPRDDDSAASYERIMCGVPSEADELEVRKEVLQAAMDGLFSPRDGDGGGDGGGGGGGKGTGVRGNGGREEAAERARRHWERQLACPWLRLAAKAAGGCRGGGGGGAGTGFQRQLPPCGGATSMTTAETPSVLVSLAGMKLRGLGRAAATAGRGHPQRVRCRGGGGGFVGGLSHEEFQYLRSLPPGRSRLRRRIEAAGGDAAAAPVARALGEAFEAAAASAAAAAAEPSHRSAGRGVQQRVWYLEKLAPLKQARVS